MVLAFFEDVVSIRRKAMLNKIKSMNPSTLKMVGAAIGAALFAIVAAILVVDPEEFESFLVEDEDDA